MRVSNRIVPPSDSCRVRSFLTGSCKKVAVRLTARRKDAEASFPLQLAGPFRSEGAALHYMLYHIILYDIILYYITLYYIILCYDVL